MYFRGLINTYGMQFCIEIAGEQRCLLVVFEVQSCRVCDMAENPNTMSSCILLV